MWVNRATHGYTLRNNSGRELPISMAYLGSHRKRSPPMLLDDYKKALGIMMNALEQYADPEFYHAMLILADRPAGGFADDYSDVSEINNFYDRPMHGKLARDTIKKLADTYPDLKYISD